VNILTGIVYHTDILQLAAIEYFIRGMADKPARDALFLFDAVKGVLAVSSEDVQSLASNWDRFTSRLIRLHWHRAHMRRVLARYEDIHDPSFKGFRSVLREGGNDFARFCLKMTGLDHLDLSTNGSPEGLDESLPTGDQKEEEDTTVQ
jgi:hypothetical protein